MQKTAAVLLFLMALPVAAAPEQCSRNGRFCATIQTIDRGPDEVDDYFLRVTDSGRPIGDVFAVCDPLITDDGHYLVCPPRNASSLRVFEISNGRLVAETEQNELLTENDQIEVNTFGSTLRWALREEDSSPQLILQSAHASELKEVVVDIASGKLVTPKRDIFASYHVVFHDEGAPTTRRAWLATRCHSGTLDDTELTYVSGQTLLDNAAGIVMPAYPTVARKARIIGWVSVEVAVDETGEVVCSRVSQYPFGIDGAVEKAISEWHFHRFRAGGKVLRVKSTFAFEFGHLDN